MSPLPDYSGTQKKDWVKVKLGDVCRVDWGNTNITKKSYVDNGQFIAVSAAGCDGRLEHYEHKVGTVVISAIGSCGKVFFPESDFTAIKNTITLTPKENVAVGKFLYYLLSSTKLPQRGCAQSFIAKSDVQNFFVELPPLPEQQRIVAFLDEAFHNTTHLTEKITRSLRETQKLKNVFLHQAFTSANTAGWEKVKLGEILKLEYGKPLPKEDRCTHGGFPAFGANGILCWSKKAYRNEPSIIVGRKGSAGEVNLTNGPFYPTDVTFFVVHNEKKALLKYLYYLLIQLNLKRLVQGVKPGINRNDVYALNTCIPPLPEQQRIVAFLDEAFTTIATLTTNAHNRLAEAQKLKNAYLQKAFESPEHILNTLTIRDPRP